MNDPFHEIRHYNEEEAKSALSQLLDNPQFLSAIKMFSTENSYDEIINELKHVDSIFKLQYSIIYRFVNFIIQNKTNGIAFSGINNIKHDEVYVFVGNHRDIVLDPVFLQKYFLMEDFNTSKIAFGDNLMTSNTLELFFKLNKMFIVKRGGTIREKLINSQLLSQYIHHSLTVEKESVWIAQRNGRAKNGIDRTQQGLVKMLVDFSKNDILSGFRELKIVPVSISYEYDPCDRLKARELILSENNSYKKRKGEDFESMKQGIFGYKGKVSLVIGKPIIDEIDKIDDSLRNNDKIGEMCKLIDEQIHRNFKLYENNYIAYDMVENSSEFAAHYSREQKEEFLKYIDKQSVIEDAPKDKMVQCLLKMYANPVKTAFGKEITITEDNNW